MTKGCKINSKRVLSFVLVIMLVCGTLLCGCSGKEQSESEEDTTPSEFATNNSQFMNDCRSSIERVRALTDYSYTATEGDFVTKVWKKDKMSRLEFSVDGIAYTTLVDHTNKLSYELNTGEGTAVLQIYDTETLGADMTVVLQELSDSLDKVSDSDSVLKTEEMVGDSAAYLYVIGYYDDSAGYTEISMWFDMENGMLLQTTTKVATVTKSYTVTFKDYSFETVDESLVTVPTIVAAG